MGKQWRSVCGGNGKGNGGEDCNGREKLFVLWFSLAERRVALALGGKSMSKERKGLGW
jgi:hypothetical protein